jgi:hypothetical protein
MSVTAYSSRTAEIAARLQARFTPQNYGYAGAIRTGQIIVENDQLVIKTPQLTLQAPLPFYTCDSASNFAARELTRQNIQAATVQLNIPVSPKEHGAIGHKVCLASEGKEDYVVGLASPIDSFLGFFPLARLEEAYWIMTYLNGVSGNPFHRSPDAQIFEHPEWILNGFDPRIRPLLAKNLADGRLATAEMGMALGMNSNSGYFFLILVANIMRFDSNSKSAVIEWNDNLYLKLPVDSLVQIRDYSNEFKSHPGMAFEHLHWLKLLEQENRILNPTLNSQGQALVIEAWPSVVEFLAKLPAEDIQAYILRNPS